MKEETFVNKKILYKSGMILSMLIFGTIGVLRRYIPYSSGVIALIRGLAGAVFLLSFCIAKKNAIQKDALKKNFLLLCLSGTFIGVNWILLFEAYKYTSVSVATICYYMAPVFVILASPIVLHEKLTAKNLLCTFVSVCGMILVSGVIETGISGIKGVCFGIGAALMYAGVIILNKFISGLTASVRTMFQLAAASVAILPYVLLTEKNFSFGSDVSVFVMLAVMGILYTGAVYTLYFACVEKLPAQTVALFSYIDPAAAVLCSVFILNEGLTLLSALGVVLVIGAAIVSELDFGRKQTILSE